GLRHRAAHRAHRPSRAYGHVCCPEERFCQSRGAGVDRASPSDRHRRSAKVTGSATVTAGCSMTTLFSEPLFQKHDTGRHPENSGRLRAIPKLLEKSGLDKRCAAGTYQPLTEETVGKLHAPNMVERVKLLAQHGGGRLDPDTVVSPESFNVALAAAGASV